MTVGGCACAGGCACEIDGGATLHPNDSHPTINVTMRASIRLFMGSFSRISHTIRYVFNIRLSPTYNNDLDASA